MDPKHSAAANLFGLSALAALQPAVGHYPTHSPALEFTGTPIGADAEAKLIDYRNEKVAGFEIGSDTLICLPQAYDLFLKNLVGGLHTVYTKLKRLDIVPRVCNVEQVRALRSLGAIQPGVNRCKLISCKDFDALYQDCTSASSRPGRPPKRSPPFCGGNGMDYLSALKKPRFAAEQSVSDPMKVAGSMSQNPIFNSQLSAQQLFPLLNPFTAQQFMMSQMMTSAANQVAAASKLENRGGPVTPETTTIAQNPTNDFGFSVGSLKNAPGMNASPLEVNGEDPLNLVKNESEAAVNGENGEDTDEKMSDNYDSGSETPNYTQQTQNTHESNSTEPPFMWPGFLKNEFFRAMQMKETENANSSVESLLLNILGLIEIAASTVKRQEQQNVREKGELSKLLEQEKAERTRIEGLLNEERRQKKIYQKRWKQIKRSKAEVQSQLLTLLEKEQPGKEGVPNSSETKFTEQSSAFNRPLIVTTESQ